LRGVQPANRGDFGKLALLIANSLILAAGQRWCKAKRVTATEILLGIRTAIIGPVAP
jgi:hypothetical protein